MTDRDALLAVFNAVCGLAEKLTGERIIVTLRQDTGDLIKIHGSSVE